MKSNEPIFYTVDQVKKKIGVTSTTTIYNYIKQGLLPFRQMGKFKRFTPRDLEIFADNCKPTTSNL